MAKIKRITVKNFKAIGEQEIDFNGCSGIVTGGNNKGKTSLLRGLIDRFRSEKAEIILKDGEKKGFQVMELTDGCRFEWNFTAKSESFAFITAEGIKQTTGLLKGIGIKYFGANFDIDKFLNSSSSVQSKTLQQLIGIDFSDLDKRYKTAYDDRSYINKQFAQISAMALVKPEFVERKSIEDLKAEILMIDTKNKEAIKECFDSNNKRRIEIEAYNDKQNAIRVKNNRLKSEFSELKKFKGSDFEQFILFENCEDFILNLEIPSENKIFNETPLPESISTISLQDEIEIIQKEKNEYSQKFNEYQAWVEKGISFRNKKVEAEKLVSSILAEKQAIIKNAKLPENFEFTETGINYNGFPLSSNQISSSQKYIAGLKLGAMVLGEIKSLHFDASFLDRNSLKEVEEWAEANGYQLLIERPDFDAGEIKYEII